ncbi:MAG: DUF1016 N-terminal domain-containing protein [Candidatus Methanoperedens sp.]|nr:DUF1016 N-terminal domain-containing protein [Candidatus Methanoperedens sp.]CAG0979053.1 Putative nuclease YhcG [Methanosarcinales archaeon]
MSNSDLNWIANFIWGIADDVLRDIYVRGKYRDVILPMVVIRRLDAVLEPTKKAVLDMKKKNKTLSSPQVSDAITPVQQPNNLAPTDIHDIGGLLSSLREVIKTARQQALHAVDVVQVQTCWTVGQHIVEFEQGGAARAAYGKRLLADLAESLTAEFGKGFDERNLRHMRAFYITFTNWNALRSELSWTQTSYLRKSAQSVDEISETIRRFHRFAQIY